MADLINNSRDNVNVKVMVSLTFNWCSINVFVERMRRSLGQNNGHTGVTNEFHLDIPSMPVWSSSPMHVQLIPTNLNGHPSGIDHLINTSADSIDRKRGIFIR